MKRYTSIVLGLALIAGACGGDDDEADTGAPPTADESPADESPADESPADESPADESPADEPSEPYRVGVIVEETGNAAVFNEPTHQGIDVAMAELEAAGLSFEVVTCDGASDPQTALSCYDRLVERDGVDAVLGPTVSASGIAITSQVNEDGIINYYLGGGYGGRDMEGNPTQFGAHATNTDVLAAIWSWAVKQEMEDVYMISTADATGQACRDFFDDDQFAEARAGLEILGQDEMAIDAQSAAPQMAKVPADADLLVLCATGGAGVVLAASYAQAGLEMPAMKLHSQALPAIEQALVGVIPDDQVYVAGFCPMAAAKAELEPGFACSESTLAFTDRLRELFPDADPTFLSAGTYDALMQVAQAVEEVGTDPEAMADWLESQSGLPGANGVYNFGPELHRGMGPESVIIGVWRGDGFYLDSMNDMPTVDS